MEVGDSVTARAPPRERRKPGDGGVFTFLFVISGLVIAAIPVVMWFYFDHNEGTLKPHTVRADPHPVLLIPFPEGSKNPGPKFKFCHPQHGSQALERGGRRQKK